MNLCRYAGIIVLLVVSSLSATARINLVTLPRRDSVQLTVYNSVDLTLVRETRFLTFRKGLNRLEFSWANTLIDPTSVEFRALTHGDEIEVLDVSFPPRVANTLEWRIQSEFTGEVKVEIRYFTSGIKWSADYLAEASRNERTMDFSGAVRVDNQSGEDYENAQVRLVVGVIRLVEEIAVLAKKDLSEKERAMPTTALMKSKNQEADRLYRFAAGAMGVAEKRAEIIKEGLSEYFLYTVEGKDTIPNGWAKRLPSFEGTSVPIQSFYKYEKEQWGEEVRRYYRFTNSLAANLGKEPLPDGAVKAFRLINDEKYYAFVGQTSVKYIPVNELVDLDLGKDPEVQIKPRLMNWEKLDLQFDNHGDVKGWTIRETWQIEIQNSKEIDVAVDIRRNFPGDWTFNSPSPHEKMDASKIKFTLPLKPLEKQTITYEVATRHGTSATR